MVRLSWPTYESLCFFRLPWLTAITEGFKLSWLTKKSQRVSYCPDLHWNHRWFQTVQAYKDSQQVLDLSLLMYESQRVSDCPDLDMSHRGFPWPGCESQRVSDCLDLRRNYRAFHIVLTYKVTVTLGPNRGSGLSLLCYKARSLGTLPSTLNTFPGKTALAFHFRTC